MPTVHRPQTSKTSSCAHEDWDHQSHEEFFRYYEKESITPNTVLRFRTIRDTVIRLSPILTSRRPCKVADIGCGAGTQSMLWRSEERRVGKECRSGRTTCV